MKSILLSVNFFFFLFVFRFCSPVNPMGSCRGRSVYLTTCLLDRLSPTIRECVLNCLFVCVEVLRPSQPNGVMSSAVSLPNHTFTGQA